MLVVLFIEGIFIVVVVDPVLGHINGLTPIPRLDGDTREDIEEVTEEDDDKEGEEEGKLVVGLHGDRW